MNWDILDFMTAKHLTVALIQHPCTPERDANLGHIVQQIRVAARQGARLILLQELHNSLYFCLGRTHPRPDKRGLVGFGQGPAGGHRCLTIRT